MPSTTSDAAAAAGAGDSPSLRSEMAANTSANVGKAQSTLLAKHVRTLEVLFSLQRENARIRQEGQVC